VLHSQKSIIAVTKSNTFEKNKVLVILVIEWVTNSPSIYRNSKIVTDCALR